MRKNTRDSTANNVIGWSIVGVCILAYPFVGFWGLFFFFVLAALLLVWVGLISAKMFDAAHDKAAQRHQKENEAAKTELAKTLKEISRLRAHGERHRPPQSVWGRN
jgi:uncharacterized iron-regulated membrane protein